MEKTHSGFGTVRSVDSASLPSGSHMHRGVKRAVRAGTLPGIVLCIRPHHADSEGDCILMQLGREGLQCCILLQQLCKIPAPRPSLVHRLAKESTSGLVQSGRPCMEQEFEKAAKYIHSNRKL